MGPILGGIGREGDEAKKREPKNGQTGAREEIEVEKGDFYLKWFALQICQKNMSGTSWSLSMVLNCLTNNWLLSTVLKPLCLAFASVCND